MPNYPDSCLRGIRKSDFWANDNFVRSTAFEPDPKSARGDGYIDASIDWEDEEATIAITKENPNSANGIVRLQRQDIDEIIMENEGKLDFHNSLRYERAPIGGSKPNPYHGNLRFAQNLPGPLRGMLTTRLAYVATIVIGRADT
jgi:hypothetical protein